MPTYEYRCAACEHEFELFQPMSEGPRRKCPECGKMKLDRLIGAGAAVIFKGSGFYQTDYRSDSYKKAAEKDKKSTENSKDNSAPKSKKDSGDGTSEKKPGKKAGNAKR